MTVDLDRIPEAFQYAAICLLLLTLRDLGDGRIPLGFGANRGMGSIHVAAIELKDIGLPDGLQGLSGKISCGDPAGLPGDLKTRLVSAWKEWIHSVTSGADGTAAEGGGA